MLSNSERDRIICVTNRKLCAIPLEQRIEQLAKIGIKKVILREKDLSEDEYTALAEKLLGISGIELYIHNFPNVARKLSIKRLHLPLSLLNEEICSKFETVGASVHSVEEAKTAEKLGASYITAGHIFATDCKRGLAPRGLEFLKAVCESVKLPVYAIGGITSDNMQSCLDAGAAGVCVMSGLMARGAFFSDGKDDL